MYGSTSKVYVNFLWLNPILIAVQEHKSYLGSFKM